MALLFRSFLADVRRDFISGLAAMIALHILYPILPPLPVVWGALYLYLYLAFGVMLHVRLAQLNAPS